MTMYIVLDSCRMPLMSFFAPSQNQPVSYVHNFNLFCSVPRNISTAVHSVLYSAQCFVYVRLKIRGTLTLHTSYT